MLQFCLSYQRHEIPSNLFMDFVSQPEESFREKSNGMDSLRQKVETGRKEINEFKKEIKNLKTQIKEKNQIIDLLKQKLFTVEKEKNELDEALVIEIKKEQELSKEKEKQKEAFLRNQSILHDTVFEEKFHESLNKYLHHKKNNSEHQESSSNTSTTAFLKNLKEKANKIQKNIEVLSKNNENSEEIDEYLQNPLAKIAGYEYSGAKRNLKVLYMSLINQRQRALTIQGTNYIIFLYKFYFIDDIKKNMDESQNFDNAIISKSILSLKEIDTNQKKMLRNLRNQQPSLIIRKPNSEEKAVQVNFLLLERKTNF